MSDSIDRQFEMWVVQQLGTGIATVDFTKVDGTPRTMNCTLQMDLIPEDKRPKEAEVVEIKQGKAPEACRVFDVDKQDGTDCELGKFFDDFDKGDEEIEVITFERLLI